RSTSASSALRSTVSSSSDWISSSLSGPPRGRLPTWVTRRRSSLLRIDPPLRARGCRACFASRHPGGGVRLLLRPVFVRRLGGGKLLGVLVARRHRGRGGRHHLMVVDVQEPQ